MKKVSKLILLPALLGTLSVSSFAIANVATGTFIWSGTVPAQPTATSFVITNENGQPWSTHSRQGLAAFKIDNNGVLKLVNSEQISFNVYETTSASDATPTDAAANYKYKLASLKVATSSSGIASEQPSTNGFFEISSYADGTLTKGQEVTVGTGGVTMLKLQQSSSSNPVNAPSEGETVQVHAAIVITSATAV